MLPKPIGKVYKVQSVFCTDLMIAKVQINASFYAQQSQLIMLCPDLHAGNHQSCTVLSPDATKVHKYTMLLDRNVG